MYTRGIVPERKIEGELHERYFLYADPLHVCKGAARGRHDWGFFKWEDDTSPELATKATLAPAQVLTFLMCTRGTEWFFGEHAAMNDLFALVHSLFDEPSTYFNVKEKWHASDWLHPASRLLFRGRMEMETQQVPMCRIVNIESLQGPATVIRDFDPVFPNRGPMISSMLQPGDSGHEYIIIRPRRNWADVFWSVASDKFGKTKRVSPKFVFR